MGRTEVFFREGKREETVSFSQTVVDTGDWLPASTTQPHKKQPLTSQEFPVPLHVPRDSQKMAPPHPSSAGALFWETSKAFEDLISSSEHKRPPTPGSLPLGADPTHRPGGRDERYLILEGIFRSLTHLLTDGTNISDNCLSRSECEFLLFVPKSTPIHGLFTVCVAELWANSSILSNFHKTVRSSNHVWGVPNTSHRQGGFHPVGSDLLMVDKGLRSEMQCSPKSIGETVQTCFRRCSSDWRFPPRGYYFLRLLVSLETAAC